MDYKNTFFTIDPMVIFKQTSIDNIKVIRLDDEFILHFESHLAFCWKLLTENKKLDEVMKYLQDTCGLGHETALDALEKFVAVLIEQRIGILSRGAQ